MQWLLKEKWKVIREDNQAEEKAPALDKIVSLSASSVRWIRKLVDESQSIWTAAKGGHADVVELLLRCRGVDANVRGPNHSTPLHVASQNGHCDVVERLIHKSTNLDLDARNAHGLTSLEVAERFERAKVVKVLKETGAVVRSQDSYPSNSSKLLQSVDVSLRITPRSI